MILATLQPAPPGAPLWEAALRLGGYDEAAKVQLLAMPGVRWDRGASCYRGPREALEIAAATLEAAGVVRLSSELQEPDQSQAPWWPDSRLFPYQVEGAGWIRWMLQRERAAFLADEMGLGKTAQAVAAVASLLPREAPKLVLCPAVVVGNWAKEIAKWTGEIGHVEGAGWHVYSYDKWRRKVGGSWAAVILDEAHKVSNPGSKQSKAVAAALQASPGALRLALSGTPMTTEPADLWHPLELLWPGRWGKAFNFQKRYCDGRFVTPTNDDGSPVLRNGEPLGPKWQASGCTRQAELAARLRHVMLRRTKAQVGAELPPRTRVINEVSIPAAARKADRRAARLLDGSAALAALLREVEPHKLAHAEALARDVMASGSRPLLLCSRRSSARKLAEALGAPLVTGEDRADRREGILTGAAAGVATIGAVEVGINLVGFDVVIFVGLDWVPSKILQAEARIHRIGQDRPCTIYYLIARGTIDEVIRDRVISRLETFAALTGAAAGDEAGLAGDLRGNESEDDLLAAIVAAAKEE